jgi:hypothetical protein
VKFPGNFIPICKLPWFISAHLNVSIRDNYPLRIRFCFGYVTSSGLLPGLTLRSYVRALISGSKRVCPNDADVCEKGPIGLAEVAITNHRWPMTG